jgi:serine/threonine protein kinase
VTKQDDSPPKKSGTTPASPIHKSVQEPVATSLSNETQATIPPNTNQTTKSEDVGNSSDTAVLPKRFDGYELLDEIARGGMGIVYRAHQKALDRTVALKTVITGRFTSDEAMQLFQTEAKAAGQLNHPGIVPVYDVGECHGVHYFSMPLIEGVSLTDRIMRGPLDPDEAARVMKTVAQTIHFTHQHNIVHRDLKPGNILIDAYDQPLIMDFGIAQKIDDRHTPGDVDTLMGTAEYMSPEQASGEPTGPLADVYSLGATLYCLLTGRPPFQSHNTLDTLLAVLQSNPVPPRRLNQRIPRDLELICLKCMEKRPQDRYQSAQDFAEELHRFLEGEPVLVHPVGNIGTFLRWMRRKPRSAAIASGLVACFTATLAISVYYNFQLNQQRSIAEKAQRAAETARWTAELSEERVRRLQAVTQTLLEELASTKNGVSHALEYSSLGEISLSAARLARATQQPQRDMALQAFQTARNNLNEAQQTQLNLLLDRIEENASTVNTESEATGVDELIARTRELWLETTENSPGVRQQIRQFLYTRTRQLIDEVILATDHDDITRDIESVLDLIRAELFIVATDDVYLTAVQLLLALEEWTSGPPSDSLKTAIEDLHQSIGAVQ